MDRLQCLMGAASTAAAVGLAKGRNTHGFDSIGFGGGGRSAPERTGRPEELRSESIAEQGDPPGRDEPGKLGRSRGCVKTSGD
jgi:hypothetical protein